MSIIEELISVDLLKKDKPKEIKTADMIDELVKYIEEHTFKIGDKVKIKRGNILIYNYNIGSKIDLKRLLTAFLEDDVKDKDLIIIENKKGENVMDYIIKENSNENITRNLR